MTKKQKERPKCREVIEKMLNEGYNLKEIAYWYDYNSDYWKKRKLIGINPSDGLRLQAKKMLEE